MVQLSQSNTKSVIHMRQNFALLFILLFACSTAFAQRMVNPNLKPGNPGPVAKGSAVKKVYTGFENNAVAGPEVPPATNSLLDETAGTSTYDLQSNSSMPSRVVNWGGGIASTAWTISLTGSEAAGFADRGTGLNRTQPDGTFSSQPTARVESVRTGFPSYFGTPNGEEWTISHVGLTSTTYAMHYAHKPISGSTWIEGNIPTTTPNGGLWGRGCAGGPDGNTIHVIYYTTPATFGGVPVDGLDGTLKYCRSSDGGATWDIIDQSLPGLTTDNFSNRSVPVEGYSIDASGNTVAIGIFSLTHDVLMIKSNDNGATWQAPRVVNDFPIDNWNFDLGYTKEQVEDYFLEGITPNDDTLALLTCDETGHVLVDNTGKTHVFFSTLYMSDPDTANDDSYTWYPGYNLGIAYWNDSWDDNNIYLGAGYSPDLDGDTLWGNATGIVYTDGYGEAFCTGPTAGINAAGELFLTYTSNHELYYDLDGTYYHHPFISRSSPDHVNWGTPAEVFQMDLLIDPFLTAFSENYFVGVGKNVDAHAHTLTQQDYTLGLTLRITGNQDAISNEFKYLAFPTDRLAPVPVGTKNPEAVTIDMSVTPNPARDLVRVNFSLAQSSEAAIEIYDATGARVMTQQLGKLNGTTSHLLNTSALNSGLYFVRVVAGDTIATRDRKSVV